ncbi:MAG TPA: SHOCT domain-containing protein [Patescibacteria group bacterium]|nr:SHOCT domain-containing protein [Patescibacteria group bacterium]
MMGYGYGMMGGFGLIPLILIGLIIFAVIKLTQSSNRNYINPTNNNDALDILNQRYANGEISDEEYTRKKKILRD